MHRSFGVAALVAFAALRLAAQTSPPPSGTLLPPLVGYQGRYLDSGETNDPPGALGRVLRARRVKVVPDRGLILMALSGSRFAIYPLDSFAARVAAGPLGTGPYGEKFLAPEVSVIPESTPGWITFPTLSQNQLLDFDLDDRGYFYLAYSEWGFAIVDSTGALVKQLFPVPCCRPQF